MRRPTLSTILAACLGSLILVAMGFTVAHRQGSLAWDDADYLRRGIRIANRATSSSIPPASAIRDILRERPKPPLLVVWIASVSSILGRNAIDRLILGSSVGPFALLLLVGGWISRNVFGSRATPVSVLAIVASPLVVSMGSKVMVETTLGMTILLTLYFATLVLESPTTKRSFALGVSIGLAMLTKLTVALLLPGPFLVFLAIYLRRYGCDRAMFKVFAATSLGILLVAGPWYLENGKVAVEFARFSSRYNIEAEGRTDRVESLDRVFAIGSQVIGWPNLVALGLASLVLIRRPKLGMPVENYRPPDFSTLASACLATGSIGLLLPAYFDPRFLAPAWPAFAVVLAGLLIDTNTRIKVSALVILSIGVALSLWGLTREPQTTTYWAAQSLIDEMVADHGVKTIGNVGDTGDWNVCKTGLINEMRSHPEDVYVLYDLSRSLPEALSMRLSKLDAVVVLKCTDALTDIGRIAPGLNRAGTEIHSALERSGRFRRIETQKTASLPELEVFVRK